jgi:LemA protein
MAWPLIIGIGAAIAVIGIPIIYYNSLVRLRNQVKNGWAQIDVQLKRRVDLIPNLVETIKGYAKHERKVFTEVTKARSSLMSAKSVSGKAKASDQLTGALKSLFAVSENYPKLEASANFQQLQEELAGTENKISYARQHYNDIVMMFNTKIQQFPCNIIAGMFSFIAEKAFEATAAERKNVKVKFD